MKNFELTATMELSDFGFNLLRLLIKPALEKGHIADRVFCFGSSFQIFEDVIKNMANLLFVVPVERIKPASIEMAVWNEMHLDFLYFFFRSLSFCNAELSHEDNEAKNDPNRHNS